TALAAPLMGMLIDRGNAGGGTLGFSWMFVSAAALAAGVGLLYAVTAARQPDRDPDHDLAETVAGRIVEAESDAGEMIAVPAAESVSKVPAASPPLRKGG
ncbi:MAG: hypothetical protein ACM3U2_14965, partial [Deltaproteobacteria bacterium]